MVSCSERDYNEHSINQKIDSLITLSRDSVVRNTKFSKKNVEVALTLVKDSMQLIELLHIKNCCYLELHEYDSAYPNILNFLNICKKYPRSVKLNNMLAAANNSMGGYFGRVGQMDSSLYYFNEAYKWQLLSEKNKQMINICLNLSSAYTNKSDFSNGAYYCRRALFYSDSLKMNDEFGFPVYYALGLVYMQLRDFELSDNYFIKAESLLNDKPLEDRYFFYNSRGNFFYFKEEYDKSLESFKKAYSIINSTQYSYLINLCELNMSDIYLHLNKLDSSQYFADRAYNYFSKINHATAVYYLSTVKAGIALKQNNTTLADSFFKLHEDTTGIEIDMILIRNKLLQDYYAQTGNFKKAYFYLLTNKKLSDSIQSEKVRWRIAELDARYIQDTIILKRDLIIQAQNNELKNVRLKKLIWLLLSFLVFVGSIFIYLTMRKQRYLLQLKHYDQITKLRMVNIRNRISPHFIFNVLNSEVNIMPGGKEHAGDLIKLLRSSLELSENISTTLKSELDFVKTYIELEKSKMGDNFILNWEMDDQIDCEKIHIPVMIVQIPVENAIKHGLSGKMGECILQVTTKKEKESVHIIIKDNGNGYLPGKSTYKGTGTGLKLIYQTIDLLNEKNSSKITFRVSKVEKGETGTLVTIHIPMNYSFEL